MSADDRRQDRKVQLRIEQAVTQAVTDAVAAVAATKGAVDGIATLDSGGQVPLAQLPDIAGDNVTIDATAFSGALMGSGITNVQELAAWLDANLTP